MQVSQHKLITTSESQLKEELAILLADLKRPQVVLDFLSTFLTETELTVLSKRLAILKRLHNNHSYEQIQTDLQVSSATISSVAQIKEKNISEDVINRLQIHDWAEKTAQKVRAWLQKE
jgi:uncharacterized protein YerC